MTARNSSLNGSGRQEQIAQRAHEIWEQAGRPEGQSLAHWLQAEAEFSAMSASEVPQANAVRARAPKRRAVEMAR